MYVRGRWVELCRRLFDLTDFEAYELVQKSDPAILSIFGRLFSMARRAATDPAVTEASFAKSPFPSGGDVVPEGIGGIPG